MRENSCPPGAGAAVAADPFVFADEDEDAAPPVVDDCDEAAPGAPSPPVLDAVLLPS